MHADQGDAYVICMLPMPADAKGYLSRGTGSRGTSSTTTAPITPSSRAQVSLRELRRLLVPRLREFVLWCAKEGARRRRASRIGLALLGR
jgi:hypothetical protein